MFLSFRDVGPRDGTQVFRFDSKCLYPLSHITNSRYLFLFSLECLCVHSDMLFILSIHAASAAASGVFLSDIVLPGNFLSLFKNAMISRIRENEC